MSNAAWTDHLQSPHANIRRRAFAKLAELSSTSPKDEGPSEISRLGTALPETKSQANGYLDGVFRSIAPTSRVPMGMRELDILLALCKAAPTLTRLVDAEQLVVQLKTYLPEAHSQVFTHSPYLHEIKPSPWTALTFQLTNALLMIGIKFPVLKASIAECVYSYIKNCLQAVTGLSSITYDESDTSKNEQDAADTAMVTVSAMGFMEASALHENFWTSHERVDLIRRLQDMLSEKFLVCVETALSTIRTAHHVSQNVRDWKRYLKRYATKGSPLGAMLLQQGFMRLVLACTSRLLVDEDAIESGDLLDQYIAGAQLDRDDSQEVDDDMIEYLVELVEGQMHVLEDGSDYLQLGSAWQQRLAFSVKAYALEAFLHCMVLDEEIADAEVLFGWLEDAVANQVQMADLNLADIVLKSLAVVAKYMPEAAANFARILLRFITQGTSQPKSVTIAAQSLAHVLRLLSGDAVITTMYSLGNVLSSQQGPDKERGHHNLSPSPEANGHHNSVSSGLGRMRTGSVISLSMSGEEETSLVCSNVAHAIVVIAISSRDSKVTALAQSFILQKIGRVNLAVDARIIEEAAVLAVAGKENEFKALLRFYSRLHNDAVQQGNTVLFEAVRRARDYLALHLSNQSPLFRLYAKDLLESIISKGDIVEGEFKHSAEVEQAAKEIAPLLKPLSLLAARKGAPHTEGSIDGDEEIEPLVREAWFNIAVHGITLQSRLGQQYYHELRVLAMYSPPLVDPDRSQLLEADVELNTILRRGMSVQHTSDQRRNLIAVISDREAQIKHLSYQKVVFLNAAFLLESLRAISGSCAEVLLYFHDPSMKTSDMGACMTSIADEVVRSYTHRALPAQDEDFSAPYVSRQLARIFSGCCHWSEKVQDVARLFAERIISQIPSALCQKSALFALMELLSLMWSSCLEAETDEYEWKSTFTSVRGKVFIELSDDYAARKRTLHTMHTQARKWVGGVLGIAPLDVKGLLQTYLSEYDDTGAYGHVSLGRSFAMEMGSMIPPFDQRLGAIDRKGEASTINVASDFIAQYTTRQEYRYAGMPEHDREWAEFMQLNEKPSAGSTRKAIKQDVAKEAQTMLEELGARVNQDRFVSTSELKDVLRRAAALLCRSKKSQTALVHYLVNIPFEVFTKESIKLGISLWLGVIHENPRMESRILTEVAQAWEKSIDRNQGIFNETFQIPDPFYVKEEFAPSDKAALLRKAQKAQSIISPHLRIMQFFESHFNAIRLGSTNSQRTLIRTITRTLLGFQQHCGHPLTREIHFHAVLLATRILRFNTCSTKTSLWRLKDQIFSAALRWFSHPPAWSFGGNRLQMKAEVKVMQDVLSSMQSAKQIGLMTSANRRSLVQKQELLEILIANEINRLNVWLHPVEGSNGQTALPEANLGNLVRVAWTEDPRLAVHLATRFPSEQVRRDVRFLILNFPDKVLCEPDAIEILLGEALPQDVSFQLKYLLYWAAVNPMQAVTYFTPAFANHPFVIQYGMRALESHSVDVTFFYVPQIVQALRYDALGYVERYIVETGKFSQLFAHQIIWNMKANAYKDEDSTVPDDIKPTLDKVMNSLIQSFSGEDKDFFEREFAFFGEVTNISGKLKPFIKASKPEKKQKIEEELRKIKVEVGVYLPSNPDGVVVGIDRKSGKPLQSHAKAPYMATFRIRKQREESNESTSHMVESAPKHQSMRPTSANTRTATGLSFPSPRPQANHQRTETSMTLRPKSATARSTSEFSTSATEANNGTYEVWQSAIFKVGDDCRQDVLALQMIAAFRGIFNSIGLDVYVFPYRVTATAPGCGVIDVLPNSISRDMLGREAVNGLHDYFITRYGGEHSVKYQEARSEFVKSMAAYSVISYLLQFKDRHNGNIMVDDKGHILHIDFGFCFDIAPGGVKFERAPFKLTPEMIAVMGGSNPETSQSYRWFEELTIKAFLASRQYCAKLCHLVSLMLDSGLPCFKPETMRNFRDRFVLAKNEREAADFMLASVKRSAGSYSTKVYDEFQLLTNGIPY
jgi:phosphatidylinositol 4-kinase